jgi:hypothetical protein
MEGLLAAIVLIAILLGFLLVAGGLVYLLALRAQRLAKRPPEPVTTRPGPLLGRKPWFGPASGGYRYSPASAEGHAVGLVAVAAAAYLVQAGQFLAALAVVVAMMFIVFAKGTSPGRGTPRSRPQARREKSATGPRSR